MKKLVDNGDYFTRRGYFIEGKQYSDAIAAAYFLKEKCGMDTKESSNYLSRLRKDRETTKEAV